MQIGSYEAQQRDRVRALKAKLYGEPKRVTKSPPKMVTYIDPHNPVEWIPPKPEWRVKDIYFDRHIIESRRILEMLRTGEIELANVSHKTIKELVLETLQRYPGVNIEQIRGVSRRRDIVVARQMAMWFVRKERPDLSFPAIGRWFGGRDHTTVLHAVKKVEQQKRESDENRPKTSVENVE